MGDYCSLFVTRNSLTLRPDQTSREFHGKIEPEQAAPVIFPLSFEEIICTVILRNRQCPATVFNLGLILTFFDIDTACPSTASNVFPFLGLVKGKIISCSPKKSVILSDITLQSAPQSIRRANLNQQKTSKQQQV